MRVMRIIARMNIGGPALQVTGLVRGMDTTRFDQRLFTGHVGPAEGDFLALRAPDLPFTRVEHLGRSPDALADVRALRQLTREMRLFQPHVVHTHTAKAGVLGRLAARMARVPVVVHTFHGHLLHGYFSPRVTRAVVMTERGLARGTTRIVAVGSKVRDELLAAGIGRRDQYVVVPPGIPLGPLPPRHEARQRLGLPLDAPVVMLVARLTAIKRPDRFVEVVRLVSQRHPDAVFAICGDGELAASTRQSAAPLGDRFRMLGWRADVEAVHAATDVAVLCSDNEGMPVSLIEAGLAGVPSVTTRVGSAAEVVVDGVSGFVTDTNATALAQAVTQLLDEPALRESMGRAARDHTTFHFSQQRLVTDIERLYDELLFQEGVRVA
jgi:glycosyltransferase involved in cell wall biosynthesis